VVLGGGYRAVHMVRGGFIVFRGRYSVFRSDLVVFVWCLEVVIEQCTWLEVVL